MKISLCRCLFGIVLSIEFVSAYADENYGPALDFYNYNTISPNVTDMFRYGEFGTSLFTGRMQQTIPIYSLDDPDFKMNIALHYNAEGFKPRKHSGYVGYNWFLEAGGCITREVSGLPDEIHGRKVVVNGTNYNTELEGMYYFASSHSELDKNEIFNLPQATDLPTCLFYGFHLNTRCHNVGNECDYEVDYMPDIFHFNFLGYQGAFMINNAGKVQIIYGDFVDVDLSGILCEWNPMMLDASSFNPSDPVQTPNDPGILPYPRENSTISIKTNDGYTYIFGGDISKLEYTINAYDHYFFLDPSIRGSYEANPAIVSTWYLAEIIAPNRRSVKYFYKPAEEGFRPGVPGGNDPLWVYNEFFNKFSRYNRILDTQYIEEQNLPINIIGVNDIPFEVLCKLAFYKSSYPNSSYYLCSMTKTCILDSILILGEQPLKIIFDNSQETLKMYNNDTYYKNCKNNYQLDAVRVLSTDETIKTVNLSYVYNGYNYNNDSFNWRFLNSAYISGIGTFQMNYNDGYYPNINNERPNYDVVSGETQLVDDYGYYVGNYSLALLQQITYPTGGYQTYSYQPYSYDKKRKYSLDTDSIVIMSTTIESKNRHGARISKVKTYDQNNLPVEVRSYTYSDGIFFDNKKVYNLAYDNLDMFSELGWPIMYQADYGFINTHMGYGKVTESVCSPIDTFKTVYKFDTGQDSYTSLNDNDINGHYFCDDNRFGVISGHMFYGSKLKKWGKLTSVEKYDSNNSLVKSTSYEYNDLLSSPELCLDTIITFSHYNSEPVSVILALNHTIVDVGRINVAEISKKLYLYPDFLTQKITKDYNTNGDSIVTCHTFSHDQKLRLKRETVTDSEGILRFTKYTYPDDINLNIGMSPPSQWPGLYLMQLRHQINKPIEIVSGYVGSNNTEYITSGAINLYATGMYFTLRDNNSPSHVIRMDTVISPNIDSIIPPGFIAGYYPYLYKTMSLSLAAHISDYLPMGSAGASVAYDSYYKLDTEYSFDNMGRVLSVKPFGKMATTYTWNGIYPATKTIGNQTWTYTHIPHVGVNSITDPRGITTYFTYDSAGRLIEEYQLNNGTKQILNAYKYHVKTE